MNIYDATEIAYKNGYEKGVKDFADRLKKYIPATCRTIDASCKYEIDDYDIDKLIKEILKNKR